ncbi:hypothetical protein BHE74_00058452 [Ensete ventricosum]|nr:hypothetical protein GW17_00041157 [Ensete ventricosum]RWW36520.1 hypothetical protein BHE74_00058452 [Ensete ventricosum]RZR99045.1 hypothetical protein BHM03_00028528 [Ensete ventricosum]
MSGVWVFKNGVVRRENPGGGDSSGRRRRKILVYLPTNDFHKRSSVHLISVPRDFSRFTSVHMYDIVVKCRNVFEVRDA